MTDTHFACEEQLKKLGGKTPCCECMGHVCKTQLFNCSCKPTETSAQKADYLRNVKEPEPTQEQLDAYAAALESSSAQKEEPTHEDVPNCCDSGFCTHQPQEKEYEVMDLPEETKPLLEEMRKIVNEKFEPQEKEEPGWEEDIDEWPTYDDLHTKTIQFAANSIVTDAVDLKAFISKVAKAERERGVKECVEALFTLTAKRIKDFDLPAEYLRSDEYLKALRDAESSFKSLLHE